MNKALILTGGALQVVFFAFHVLMSLAMRTWPIPKQFVALFEVFNIHGTLVIGFFALVSLVFWKDLLFTRLGKIVTGTISLYYLVRVVNDVVFLSSTPWIIASCLLVALIYAGALVIRPHEEPKQMATAAGR